MSELIGSVHFLALIGLTGAAIDTRIAPLPQWVTPFIIVVWLGLIVGYAWAVGTVYG